MARTLDATQTRDRDASLYVINMVKITTYTEQHTRSGTAKSFYLASRAIRYDYGNTGTDVDFWPLFLEADPRNQITHLPSPGDRFDRSFTVRLSNEEIQGQRLVTQLRKYNITGAEIEFSQLTLPSDPGTGLTDLSAMDGDEHTLFYTGVVESLGRVTNTTIELECGTEYPSLANFWTYARGTGVDPKDVGRRYPMPFGRSRRVQGIGRDVGWVTTTAAPVEDGITVPVDTISLTDASGLSGSDIDIMVGNEVMRVTPPSTTDAYTEDGTTTTAVAIVSRGLNGTKQQRHTAGEVVITMPATHTWTFAGYATSNISRLYIRNPVVNDHLVEVPSGFFTFDYSDTTTDSGKTTTTVSITSDNLKTVLRQIFTDVDFTPPTASVGDPEFHAFQSQTPRMQGRRDNDANVTTNTASTFRLTGQFEDSGDDWESAMHYTSEASNPSDEINHWWLQATYSMNLGLSTFQGGFDFRTENIPGFANGTILINSLVYSTVSNETAYSTLFSGNGLTVGDLITDQNGPPAIIGTPYDQQNNNITNGVTMTIHNNASGIWLARIIAADAGDATLAGATVGFGLDIYADIDGVVTPDNSYSSGSAGTLITRQADLVKYFVEQVGGETMDAASYATSLANLDLNDFSGDFRALGETFEEIIASLAFNSRSNIFPEDTNSGRVWKMLQANSDYTWERPTEYIRNLGEGVSDTSRAIRELASHYTFRYAIDTSLGDSEDAYRGVVVANPSTSDVSITTTQLSDAQKRFGTIEAPQQFFRAIRLETTAEEVAGYYVHEGISQSRRVLTIPGVPWYEAYRLQVGDIRWVVPPWNRIADDDRIFPMDAVGTWTSTNGTISAVAAPAAPSEGSAVIKVAHASSTFWTCAQSDYGATDRYVDMRGRAISFRVLFDSTLYGLLNTPGAALVVILGSTAGGATDHVQFHIPKTNLPAANTWATIVIPMDTAPDAVTGTIDFSRVTFWYIAVSTSADGAGSAFYLDDIRVVDAPVACRIVEIGKSTTTEHSEIIAVEVPAPISLAAASSFGPVTSSYLQKPQQVYGAYTSGDDRGQRFYVRDGDYESLNHFVQLSGGESPESATALDIEFPDVPYPERGGRQFRIWANRVGAGAIQSIGVSDTQGGSSTAIGSIPASSLPIHDNDPAWFTFSTTEQGNWLRIYGGGPAATDFAQVFSVERELLDVVAADMTETSQSTASSAAGTGADLANAIDADPDTYATLDDGEYVQATFATPGAAYDFQVIGIDYVSESGASVPDGMAAYLGDVRGGSPTAVLTPDSDLTNDVVTSNNVGTDERSFATIHTTVSDDDVFVYGQAGDAALRVYRINRTLYSFPTRYTQMPKAVYNGHDSEKARRFSVRARALQDSSAGWNSYVNGNESVAYYDVEFTAPPSAITTDQTIKFDISAWLVEADDVEVLVGATQGAGSVEYSFTTSAEGGSHSFTTATAGNWVRFRAKTTADTFKDLRNVVRVLPDSLPPTIEAQDGDSTTGVGASDTDNAIDGSTTTYATITPNGYLKVTMPTPSAYDAQQLVIDMRTSTGTGVDFSIWIGGVKGVGTSLTGDGPNDLARFESVQRMKFETYLDTSGDDFYIYNEGAHDLRVFEVSIKRLDW